MRCLGEKEAQVSLLKVENWYSAIGTGLKGEVSGSRWKTFDFKVRSMGLILRAVESHSTFCSSRKIGLKKLLTCFS